jgi:fatty acid desaturase
MLEQLTHASWERGVVDGDARTPCPAELRGGAVYDEDLTVKQSRVRRAVSREEFSSWVEMRPARVYRDLLLNWGSIAVALCALSLVPAWWMYGIAFLVVGSGQYGLFLLAHDGLHKTLHPNRTINDLIVRWLVYGPMFMGLEDARRNHLEHHQTLGTEADPDRYIHTLGSKNTPLRFLLFCSGLATFGATVLKVTPFGMLLKKEDKHAIKNSSKAAAQTSPARALVNYLSQRVPVAFAQLILLAVFLFSGLPFWSYLLLWIAPIYFCVFLPDEIRAFCEHAVLSTLPDKTNDSQRLITFRPSRLEARFFAPHNMNYHAEHHLWPGIPYYNLPKAHEFIRERVEVSVRGSYLSFICVVLRYLSRQAKAGER